MLALEQIQSKIAKSVLGVPVSTVNICAQTELGLIPVRLALYKLQLTFYFRVLAMPQSRWVKKALLEHLSLTWHSPYLKYISALRDVVRLPFVPPTVKYLKCHLYQWSLSEVNTKILERSLPYVAQLVRFGRQQYVRSFEHKDTLAQFRLSNAGLGNRFTRFPGVACAPRPSCPLCTSLSLSEAHVAFFCPAVEKFRRELGLDYFRRLCWLRNNREVETFSLFVNGLDCNGAAVSFEDNCDCGLALDTIRGHWLAQW